MKNRLKVAARLKKLRGDKSRAEVAKALGVSVSAVAMHELGERMPRDDVKNKYAKIYNTSVEAIFFA